MAFRLPTFNLTCDIYPFGTYPAGTPRLTAVPCQWRTVTRLTAVDDAGGGAPVPVLTEILLPVATDIRGNFDGTAGPDDVLLFTGVAGQLPFTVYEVVDVGKGFTNEYRLAIVAKLPPWPVPIP